MDNEHWVRRVCYSSCYKTKIKVRAEPTYLQYTLNLKMVKPSEFIYTSPGIYFHNTPVGNASRLFFGQSLQKRNPDPYPYQQYPLDWNGKACLPQIQSQNLSCLTVHSPIDKVWSWTGTANPITCPLIFNRRYSCSTAGLNERTEVSSWGLLSREHRRLYATRSLRCPTL